MYSCDGEGLVNTVYEFDLELEKTGGRVWACDFQRFVASRCYQPE